MTIRRASWTFVMVALLLGSASTALAQTNSDVNAGVNFDFRLPGARSLALGGAFVALADDATTAVANPAGLILLSRPEVSLEARVWRFSNLAPVRGHAFGAPTSVGVDTISGIVDGESSDSLAGLSFLSFVAPRGRVSVGLFRHERARYRANLESEGVFLTQPGSVDRVEPFRATMKLDIVNYGASLAVRFENGISIGGGLTLSDFGLETLNNRYLNPPAIFTIPPAQYGLYTARGLAFGPPNFDASNVQVEVVEQGDDFALGGNFGFLYRHASGKWSAAMAAGFGPEFKYDATARWGPAAPTTDPSVRAGDVFDEEVVPFKVPDLYSFGASWRATDRLLVVAQYDRVRFSQMSRDIQEVYGIDETNPPAERAIRSGLRFPDSNQARLGVEFAILSGDRVIAIRGGAAYESDHRMRFDSPTTEFPRLNVLFRPGTDQWHFTPGVGIAFQRYQFDAAVDLSQRTQSASVSFVYRF